MSSPNGPAATTGDESERRVRARVFVTLKPGVLDPQGQAVGRTLARMGYDEVAGVRIGKLVEMEIDVVPGAGTEGREPEKVRERVSEMCRRLIANTVIEDFRIEIEGDES